MAKLLKLRRGTTSQHGSFTGAEGEVTVDTDKETLVVHNGSTAGGFALARADNPDNQKVRFGTGNDLEIYHNGSDSFVRDQGTGGLYITGSTVGIKNAAANETGLLFTENSTLELYHDGSKKAQTHPNGFELLSHLLMGDNDEIRLGNSTDLTLEHNGTHSKIINNTGDLYIGSGFIGLYNTDLDELKIAMYDNGAVKLYYDHSKKFETYSGGAIVTGTLNIPDGSSSDNRITLGSGGDLKLYHDGSHSYITNTTGNLYITDDAYIELSSANGGEKYATFTKDGTAELYYNGSKMFTTADDGVVVRGIEGGASNLYMYADEGDDNADKWRMQSEAANSTFWLQNYYSGSWESALKAYSNGQVELFYDNVLKAKTASTGFHIESGNLSMNDSQKVMIGASNDLQIYHNGTNYIDASNGHFYIRNNVASDAGGNIYIQAKSGENSIYIQHDGLVSLYHDNSERLTTTSTGLEFRGGSTGFYGVMSTNDGNNRGYLHANNSETVGFLDDQQHWLINGTKNGAANLYYDNSKKVETVPNGLNVIGRIGVGDDTPGYELEINAAAPQIRLEETSTGGNKRLDMWVNSSGKAYIGANQSAQDLNFQVTNNDRLQIQSDGDIVQKSQAGANDTPGLIWNGGSSSQQANLVKLHAKQVSNWGGEFMVKVKGANGSLSDNWQDAIRVFPEGSVTKPKQPSFCARHTSRHTYSHGGNNHSYNTEMWDVNGDYNTSNNRFTAPQNGYYFLLHVVNVRGNTSGVLEAKIYINDSEVLRSYEYYGGGNHGCTVQACGVRYLNANDYVTPHSHWGGSTGADQHWENSGTKPLVFFQGHLAH